MDSTMASTELTVKAAVLWTLRLAAWVSTFLESFSVPVSHGSLNIELKGLLKIIVLLEIALSLIGGNSLSAVWISSFEVTPSEPVLLCGLLRGLVLNSLDITVPIEIALGHVVVHLSHAVLVSLLFMTKLLPVLLGLSNWVSIFEGSLEVWISSKVAFSLVIINMLLEQEVVSLLLHIVSLMGIIFSSSMAILWVQSWALWIVVWVSIDWLWWLWLWSWH